MTDSQALQVEQLAGGDVGRCIVDRRTQTAPASPAPARACGARRGDRRRGQAEARVSSPPVCAPRGACLRRARLRRLRSGPAFNRRRQRRLGLACGPPLSSAKRSGGARNPRARPSAHTSRQPQRSGCHAACTKPRPVTAVACTAWSLAGGRCPPRDPPPPCGRGSARSTPVRGHARYGHPGRAARPGAKSARGRTAAAAPYARMAATPSRRAGAPLPRAAPGLGGRRAPGRCAGAGVAFAPGPGCGRSPRPPRSARQAGAGAAARTPGRCRSRQPAAHGRPAGRCPSCGPFVRPGLPRGPCLGPRAPGRRRPQPRSLRCAPLRGRLRRGFDPATGQGQRLRVAAARSAPGALFH